MKTHLLKAGFNQLTACGDINGHKTSSPITTECKNCRRTNEYRKALETLRSDYTVRGEDAWNIINDALGVAEDKPKIINSADLHPSLFDNMEENNAQI